MDNEIKDKDLAVGDGAGDLITVAPVQLGSLEDPDSNVPLWTYMGRNRRSLGWCLYLLMLMVGYGFDGLLTGSLVGISAFKLHFGYYDEASGVWIISALWQSLWTACTSITMMLGAIFVGQIHGRIGLRASLVVACVFAIAGIITEQVCKNAAQFLGAKCLAGFGYGIQTALGIMTIPEYAPTRLRGPLGACLNTFILFGGWLADGVLTGTGQVYPDSSRAYQIPFALQYLFVAILVIGLVFVPESASYHLRRDDVLGAKEALTRLHGPQRTARIERELELAIFSYRLDAQNGAQSVGILEPLKKSHWRRSIIPIGLLCFQQLVGGSFVTSYLTYFYEVAGTPDSLSLDLGMMSFSVQVVGNLVSWYAIDKLGRRYTLLVGLGSMTVALLLIGITWAVRTAASLWCMVAFMTIWAFLYQLSIGACGYSVSAEAPAARLRSPTIGLAQALAQVCAWAMGFATPYMINPDEANLGGFVGFVFAGLSALAFVFTFFFVPETSGRTLAEIDELWAEKIPVRRWKGYVNTVRPTDPRA